MDEWMLPIYLSSMMELKNYATTNHVQFWRSLSTYIGLVKVKQKSSRKDQSNHDVLLSSPRSDKEVRILHAFVCSAFYCHMSSTKQWSNSEEPSDVRLTPHCAPQDSRGIVSHRACQFELSLNTGLLIGNWFQVETSCLTM